MEEPVPVAAAGAAPSSAEENENVKPAAPAAFLAAAATATAAIMEPAAPTDAAVAAAAAAPGAAAACQVPPRRFAPDGKVTSVDLTPDGAYVVAGCSDGTIRLYSMADAAGWGCEGAILGQIHAKGLITNLIFHVEVRCAQARGFGREKKTTDKAP